jgi:hypothetical protein
VPEVAPASSRKGWSRPWSGRGGKWDGADTHHPRALTPGAGTEGPPRGKTLSPPRHEGKWCPSVLGLDGLAAPGDQGSRPFFPGPGWGLP